MIGIRIKYMTPKIQFCLNRQLDKFNISILFCSSYTIKNCSQKKVAHKISSLVYKIKKKSILQRLDMPNALTFIYGKKSV